MEDTITAIFLRKSDSKANSEKIRQSIANASPLTRADMRPETNSENRQNCRNFLLYKQSLPRPKYDATNSTS